MLTNKIPTERGSPLAMGEEEFRTLGSHLIDRNVSFLNSLSQRPVTPAESPATVRKIVQAERFLPQEGEDPALLLDCASYLLLEHSLFNGHPQWPSTLSGIHPLVSCAHRCFGDLLASAINPKVGAWLLSPMASEIEARTIRWITEIVGCYTNCGGLFVSDGNMANLICFLAARQAKAAGMCEKWG